MGYFRTALAARNYMPDLLASCTTDATEGCGALRFFSSTRIFPHHHPDPKHLSRPTNLGATGHRASCDRAVAEMSSGEAKRTLIARALVHIRRRCFLMSPATRWTSARNSSFATRCASSRNQASAFLLVTHHVSEIIPEIERVILLREDASSLMDENLHPDCGTSFEVVRGCVRLGQNDGYFHLY